MSSSENIRMQHWTVALSMLAGLCAGCSSRPKGYARYVPDPAIARRALVQTLEAWRGGQPPGTIKAASAPIQSVDSQRRPGQTLERYEILGEVGGDGPRTFAVRLTLANPTEERKERYVVAGISPLWVFREEDYQMLAHWEHPMPAEGSAARQGISSN